MLETVLGSGVTPPTTPELKLLTVRLGSVGAVTLPSRGHLVTWEDGCEKGLLSGVVGWEG